MVSGEDLVEERVQPEGDAVVPVEAGSDSLAVPVETHEVKVVHVFVIDSHAGPDTCTDQYVAARSGNLTVTNLRVNL